MQTLEILIISITILTNFVLAWLILVRAKLLVHHILFSLVTASFGIWALCLLFYKYTPVFSHLFWIRGAYLSATVMELFIVSFSFYFPRKIFPRLRIWAAFYGAILLVGTIYLLYFTHLWIVDIAILPGSGIQTVLGPAYIYWTLGEWVLIFWSVVNLFFSYKSSEGLYKAQLQYLLSGFFVFGIVINIPDVIYPLLFHDTKYFSISSVAGLIFTGTITYIAFKHRFMDLHRVFRQAAFYSISILGLGVLYYCVAYIVALLFFRKSFDPWYTAAAVLSILLIKYTTRPIRRKIEAWIGSLFYSGLYTKEQLIREISELSIGAINYFPTIDKTLEIFYNSFRPKFVIALTLQEGKISLFRSYPNTAQAEINFSKDEILFLEKVHKILVTDELKDSPEKKILLKKKIAVIVPLHIDEWKRFIIFGKRQSGVSYYDYDIETLHFVRPTITLIAQHTRQVQQIRDFNKQLKKEILSATAELRSANQHLQAVDTLKDEFISIASHELKTPTTAIKGFIWLVLRKDKSLSSYAKEKLVQVANLTDQLTALVNDMLDVSRLEGKRMKLYPEHFDIVNLAEEVRDEFTGVSMQKKVTIQVMRGKEGFVFADKRRVHQVLRNLMSNGIKYTSEGGKVIISFEENGKYLETRVMDNGIGIKKSDFDKLFTKFGKLENSNVNSHLPGTGLGLYITKNIIQLSKGKIWVTSTLGKGSTFGFTLPKG